MLAIVVIIVQWGFIAGILIGVVIGCATFALSASRIDSVKIQLRRLEYRSSLDRSRDDQAICYRRMAARSRASTCRSYLFFGSANRLYQHVKTLLQHSPECRFLIFDFKLVTGIDSSAAYSFAQIKRAAQDRDIKLVLVASSIRDQRPCDPATSSPAASASCRNWITRSNGASTKSSRSIRAWKAGKAPLRDWFTQILGSERDAAALMHRCERIEVDAGEIIVRAGDAADSMHFILDGRVGIMIPAGEGRTTRVRSLGRYTTIGEMGLVSHAPRSATIRPKSRAFSTFLNAHQFEAIKGDNPELGQKLLTYFVSVMAERLTFANRMIAVLRR